MTTKPDLPKWVPSDEVLKITDPGTGKKNNGFIYKEKPAFQFINWLWNSASKWFLGLQGSYYDIVIGSAAQVTANEATHDITDLDDTLAVAGSRVLILDGTHTLLGNLALSNNDLKIKSESPLAILDISTFTATFSGARNFILLRVTNSGAGDVIVSGAGSVFEGIDLPIANVAVSNGAIARTSGTTGGIKIFEFVGKLTGTAATATNALSLGGSAAALFAKLASPAFTGSPTAPTKSPGDNSTNLATTAYTDAAVGGAASVGQTQLKTAQGEVSFSKTGTGTASSLVTLPGGTYGFYPQTKSVLDGSNPGETLAQIFGDGGTDKSTYATYVRLTVVNDGAGGTDEVFAQQRYIQSSPPYKIGDIGWGHFFYLLCNKSTGEIICSYEAQDPPWAYNGPNWLHKNDPELLALIPHPFPDFGTALFPESDFEVVLVDLRDFDVNLWLYDNIGKGKTILGNHHEFASIGKTKTRKEVGLPEIIGFTDKIKIKARN